ncbi:MULTISPECIES: hypothetical protein [unclassified Pseudomonas]|uniref:hypothetical protein n=1 Tax=unclassified Pseudomonas TaxID=196821 RepID=UPI0021146439|nr:MULTISPECIES: hypothetical protein [unclassified Pseudomonas]
MRKVFSWGFEASGLNTALISRLTALAAGTQANNNSETTLRTATDKGFIYTTSYINANPCKLGKNFTVGARLARDAGTPLSW